MKKRTYLCIDLKSFYASVECVDRGLDPFKVNLVVADPDRGGGTMCLAVSPAMKALGVPGRCRVFEIPSDIPYIKAKPRMSRYLAVSAKIVGIYLRYVSEEDVHVYSVDECFIDVTDYLRLYGTTPKEFAETLRTAVFRETGICATAGIGTNLFLAKVALDIVAKHVPDHIGVLDEETFRQTVAYHRPITDIWNVGPGIARTLASCGVYDLHGVTELPEEWLLRKFGVGARYLMLHARGEDPCTMGEIKAYVPKTCSLSHSQVLFRDYGSDEAKVILSEMVEELTLELIRKKKICGSVSLGIMYSNSADVILPPSFRTKKLSEPTQSYRELLRVFFALYDESVPIGAAVRRVSVAAEEVRPEEEKPLTFFCDTEAEKKEKSMLVAISDLQKKYGKNAVLRGRDMLGCATRADRNRMIGGHNA